MVKNKITTSGNVTKITLCSNGILYIDDDVSYKIDPRDNPMLEQDSDLTYSWEIIPTHKVISNNYSIIRSGIFKENNDRIDMLSDGCKGLGLCDCSNSLNDNVFVFNQAYMHYINRRSIKAVKVGDTHMARIALTNIGEAFYCPMINISFGKYPCLFKDIWSSEIGYTLITIPYDESDYVLRFGQSYETYSRNFRTYE